MTTFTKETLSLLTPQLDIKEGNKRFVNHIKLYRNFLQQVNETSAGQFPFAVIPSYIDSLIHKKLLFIANAIK